MVHFIIQVIIQVITITIIGVITITITIIGVITITITTTIGVTITITTTITITISITILISNLNRYLMQNLPNYDLYQKQYNNF